MSFCNDTFNSLHLNQRQEESNPQDASNSVSGLISTLVPSFIFFVVEIVGFIILRRRDIRTYMPRTYLETLHPSRRTPQLSNGLFNWIISMYRIPDIHVLQHHSLDGYLLLRFLKLISSICLIGCLITWPVLLPVNASGSAHHGQLDMLSISNVGDTYCLYFAHTFMAWIFIGFVFLIVTRESIFCINLRHAYMLSPAYTNCLSSHTVLFTAVPQEYLNKEKVLQVFGCEKVKNIWINTDTRKLEKQVYIRKEAIMKLEAAVVQLIQQVNIEHSKTLKKKGNNEASTDSKKEVNSTPFRCIYTSQRPTHRLKPFFGTKVDTINWARLEIEQLSVNIEDLQAKHRAGIAKLVPSIFIEFSTQEDAQAAFQSVSHSLPFHLAPKYIGLDPTQIIWENLRLRWWEHTIRYAGTMTFVLTIIFFWALPTAIVGLISNANAITHKLAFLRFIDYTPSWIKGIISGFLPTVLMSVLMSLVPVVLRLMAKLGGAPSLAVVELRTQNFYFYFQVIQVFFIVTATSAATSVIQQIINHPMSIAQLLATNLPKASNFYISYVALQGLSFSASTLLQVSGLILNKVTGYICDTTPRKMFTRWSTLTGLSWGTVYPALSLLVVIAISYSCIAPLVLGFATIGLYLYYFAYRYDLLYVSNVEIDTQGQAYFQALQHITVGCYLLATCLIGLFAINTTSSCLALGPLILMIIFLLFMALYHMFLNQGLKPLIHNLPVNLEAEKKSLYVQPKVKGSDSSSKIQSNDTVLASCGPKNDNISHHSSIRLLNSRALNFFKKYLRPDKYADCWTLHCWFPNSLKTASHSPEIEQDAYFHPSVTAQIPLLWIPHDRLGISQSEIKYNGRVVPMTDNGAWLDNENKIKWDIKPPIYSEKTCF